MRASASADRIFVDPPLVENASGVKGATLGTWLYDVTHPNESKNLSGTSGSKYVQPDAGKPVQVKTAVKLDGRVLAEVTTLHQARELARPQTGASTFDSVMNLPPPALR